ncbi:hypothetical protein [Paractinoplanes atraurantiacus]|uniref:Uncharacterized protein n=1 Tax=Paractinoplanes atraurantiacus TaxID=1036182 RepID=A0A285KLY4_9ACTN|nr:hypothetical protein [Actinoplanes atraurantiacus]SNY72887.1 hypothetical protein SAMN05421748_14443 [Actinoplanes atraurantiacus]
MTDLATPVEADDADTATSPPTPPTTRPDPPIGQGGPNQLTRTTVNLTPRAVAALNRMAGNSRTGGPTKTELINRGVQVLEIIEGLLERNNGRLTIKHEDGTEETIYIL